MAQAGLHGLAGLLVRRWTPGHRWLMLGIVLGNLAPDLDNVAVAVATLTGDSTEGLHRTFTHSLITVAAIIALGYLVSALSKRPRWGNLGLGLGLGIVMHILFDLLIWFNGVELLWPLSSWVNFWGDMQPPEWWRQLMMPAELLAFALYFWALGTMARHSQTDIGFQGKLRFWMALQGALFIIFTGLVYVLETGFMTIYGAVYLLSLFLAVGVTIRMRDSLEANAEPPILPVTSRWPTGVE
jgi:membrane-bound metal-dependent hydrolase YbcI (DUF457 family)